jgi:hypothetical protein
MERDVRTMVSWLHLSDVHIGRRGREWDWAEVLGSLGPAVTSLVERAEVTRTPDLLFFTGDLAFGNQPRYSLADQFSEGAAFLDHICELFKPRIPWDCVFIVPGNHDVNRDRVSTADKHYLSPDTMTLSKIEEHFTQGDRQFESFMARQEEYRSFICDRFPHISGLIDKDRLIYSSIKEIGGWKLGIAGFNSAWSCGQDGERGRLWMAGHAQSQRLLPKLKDADFRVALLHHPAWWLTEEDARAFWQPRLQSAFDAALHGHEHTIAVDANQFGHVRIAAGALYEHARRPASFNLVKFSPEGKWAQVWLSAYDHRISDWVPDRVFGSTDRGVCTLDRFGLRRPVEDAITSEAMQWLYADSLEQARQDYAQVTNLDLARRPLEDLGPLARMTGLKVLNLRNTLVRDLEPLRGLTRLERLGLAATFVRDLGPLANLRKLKQLGLAHTDVRDLTPLVNLAALHDLDLRHTRIGDPEDIEPVAALIGLERLYLGGTAVRSLAPLEELARRQKRMGVPGLEKLGLMDTHVDDESLESLTELSDLRFLSLRHTTVSKLDPLARLTKLGELRLANTMVRDLEPLKELSDLEELDLTNAPVGSLSPLHGLTRLSRLHLRGAPVRQEEIRALEHRLPGLTIVV